MPFEPVRDTSHLLLQSFTTHVPSISITSLNPTTHFDIDTRHICTYTYQPSRSNSFQSKTPQTNQLIGPFGIFLHSPPLAHAFFGANSVLSQLSSSATSSAAGGAAILSPTVRETVILTVGAHFGAGYEMYAHGLVARAVGLDERVVREIVGGGGGGGGGGQEKPAGLNEEEGVAWEVARSLTNGKGALDRSLWDKGNKVLGEMGMFLLVQYVGYYCWVCVVLNGFGAVVPGEK